MSIEFIAICIAVCLSSIVLSGIAIVMAAICWAKVVGLQNSTHQVQYVPLDEIPTDPKTGEPLPQANTGKDLDKQMLDAFGEEKHNREYI